MKLIALVITALFAFTTLAHEGHDHDAPTTIRAPKGGQVKALDESRVEVVSKGKSLRIYFYDLEMKELSPSEFQVKAHVQLPKKKEQTGIQLMTAENHLETEYDAKGSHRYTLRLEVTHNKTQRTEKLNFQIEPKK